MPMRVAQRDEALLQFVRAAQDTAPVAGLTHGLYKYPARFSPRFAKAAIEAFSLPGDWVLDPFMGGGTTVVEALACGRHVVGCDINELSLFVTRAKTTVLTRAEARQMRLLALASVEAATLRPERLALLGRGDRQVMNLSGPLWRFRDTLALMRHRIAGFPNGRVRTVCTATLLHTAQRLLDCRLRLPSLTDLRREFLRATEEVLQGNLLFREAVERAWTGRSREPLPKPVLLHASVREKATKLPFPEGKRPRLILTSPPYPGVHVLYDRWQILGRCETDAPYWITGCRDGWGASFYTFGDRRSLTLNSYFDGILESFSTMRCQCRKDTTVVQMMAFSAIEEQLPRYLNVMERAGFVEVKLSTILPSSDARIWRTVPNRKWYSYREHHDSSSEVVLIHQPREI
jgi:hypothetical protein